MYHIIADESLTASETGWPLVVPTYLFHRKLLIKIRQRILKDREADFLRDHDSFKRWDFYQPALATENQWIERSKLHQPVLWKAASYQDVPIIDVETKQLLALVRCRRAEVFVLKPSDPCYPKQIPQ